MSRIEKAMERARELAAQESSPKHPGIQPESSPKRPDIQPGPIQQPFTGHKLSQPVDVENQRLVAINSNHAPIAEEYRKLKSIIKQIINKDPSHNMLLITSSVGGEGKSLTAINLAISLAQDHDNDVLIVDADLRKPSIAKYLGITTKKGLAECLKENVALDSVVLDTGLGNLKFLPAGEPDYNPVELYSSQKMKNLLAQIKERFADGYVIIDSSPVLPFAEARILSNLADGVIFIVKESGASLNNITEALQSLYEANVVGLVYNKATCAGLSGGYHYYYYSYDYSRRSENKPPEGKIKTGGILSRLWKSKTIT